MFNDPKIGEVSIQAYHIAEPGEHDEEEPVQPKWAFYHIMKNGRSNGRILASFHAQKIKKTNKRIPHEVHESCPIVTEWIANKILLPIYAIRNLP